MFLVTFSGAHIASRVADQGLAHALGLVTLRHGTNPLSWVGIHILGALPKQMGGAKFGGDYQHNKQWGHQNVGRFYMMHDSDYFPKYYGLSQLSILKRIIFEIDERKMMRTMPKGYSACSTRNLILSIVNLSPDTAKKIGTVIAYLLPTIKFRFTPETVKTFTPDKSWYDQEIACSTDQWISPLNIGIVGTVWNSLTYRTVIRMANDPYRVITGVVQLALVAVSIYASIQASPALLPFLMAHKVSICAGTALAIV